MTSTTDVVSGGTYTMMTLNDL